MTLKIIAIHEFAIAAQGIRLKKNFSSTGIYANMTSQVKMYRLGRHADIKTCMHKEKDMNAYANMFVRKYQDMHDI